MNEGYSVVTERECDFRAYLETHPDVKAELNVDLTSPIMARDALFGGRCEAMATHYKCNDDEKILAYDVVSLYPSICRYEKIPVGGVQRIFIGEIECSQVDIAAFEGLIKCTVLPPQDLEHPILPLKLNGRLIFCLCFTCAKNASNQHCVHTPEQREFSGTWVVDEVRMALRHGYNIRKIIEMHEFKVEKEYFKNFISHFYLSKMYSSGRPDGMTDDEFEIFINEIELIDDVIVDRSKIDKNPALRSISKLVLNSMWGKFAQAERSSTRVLNNVNDLYELTSDISKKINGIEIINENFLLVNFDDKEALELNTTNVVVAAYVTAFARMKLLSYLIRLPPWSALYCDTDSVFFVVKADQEVPFHTGHHLGDMSSELSGYGEDAFISELFAAGPKSYLYNVRIPSKNENKIITKIKGISLNFKNLSTINFDTFAERVNNYDSNDKTLVDATTFVRDKDSTIRLVEKKKEFRALYAKRRVFKNRLIPFGFDETLIDF